MTVTLTEPERQIVAGALDRLAIALADRGYTWSEGDQLLYEQALQLLKIHNRDGRPFGEPVGSDDDVEDEDQPETWKQ